LQKVIEVIASDKPKIFYSAVIKQLALENLSLCQLAFYVDCRLATRYNDLALQLSTGQG